MLCTERPVGSGSVVFVYNDLVRTIDSVLVFFNAVDHPILLPVSDLLCI